ncbi:hypothetical protein M011DRAFT_472723 [Sporormia fimetaria CBS 119925]|uniref:K Homology domain-containing protein n=1 Tax=Sporormia fimetaria CBS 119925 TaxID=1340428 RepID=A0A6A6UVP1_9PLEO|nr:hypothetical protein M011DRAFT_472723 [Sporormia fimetaria CBS 119925]
MSSEATANGGSSEGLTPAQQLMQQHERHHSVTIEDVPDEEDLLHPPPSQAQSKADNTPALSDKAAGKQKATDSPSPAKKTPVALDTSNEELFPALGAVKPRAAAPVSLWGKKPAIPSNGANGQATNNAAPRTSTPATGPAMMNLPGKDSDHIVFLPRDLIPRDQLKKPLKDIIADINRRSKAKLEVRTGGPQGMVTFTATGPKDAVRQALTEVANEVAAKQSIKLAVPASVRPYIIGRGGAKIQEISKRSGARIQVPKQDEAEDEDSMIDVVIEGNALTIKLAKHEIDHIVKERTSNVNLRVKDIPAEFYPFLAGPHNSLVSNLENGRDVRVQIPHYTNWATQEPPQVPRNQPVPFVPQPQFPIQIAGDREHAQQVQAELERQVQRLRQQLAIEQRSIERGRHQFIVGDRGGSLHDFLEETGCTVVLPPSNDDSETIYVVGPPDRIEAGVNKLEDLAASMQMAIVDAAREHRGANSQRHAHNLTRYLRQRQALDELMRMHEASIVAPRDRHGPTAWEIYAKNGKNSQKARSDIQSVFASHPPSRFSSVNVDPFFHQVLQQRNAQHIRDEHGVHLVFPEDSDDDDIILVYEGQTPSSDYAIPRGPPPASEQSAYQQGLQQAQQYIEALTRAHQNIVSRDVGAPPKFYPKIERYVDQQQRGLPHNTIPVQVTFGDRRPAEARRHSETGMAMRGPSDAVDDLVQKVLAFIEQEEKDELERGHLTTFDFPQKYANFLIGKGGENIRKLRDEFDVEIKVDNGVVTLKGPPAKANACKAHILALGKRLDDEATHTLKIKPQYHRDLIGPKGNQVNRLQDRYHVRINFPRSAAKDEDVATEGGASQRNMRIQPTDEVVIRGPRKGADEAREELLNLLQYYVDNSHVDTVSVAQSQIPSLIGSQGREMDNLRAQTQTHIDVPNAKDADASGRVEIKIKGSKKNVEEAKKILQERVKVFDDTVVKTLDVDRKHHRTLIGPSGSNIRDIVTSAGGPSNQRELARMVRFPRADSEGSTIKIEGPKAVVEKIVSAIEERVKSLENTVTEVVDISPDKHRLLIGRGGETRRSLEHRFKISLDVPRQDASGAARSQVKISGEPANVEKAKEHILDLVKGQEGETVQVPQHLHHYISDNGRFFARLKNDHRVTVDHAGQKVPPKPTATDAGKARKGANGGALPLITDEDADGGAEEKYSWEIVDHNPSEGADTSATIPWILRGPADSLPRARQALETAIAAASKPNSTGYLILPDPRSYRLVVGPGGSTINEIRKKTGTKLQVPRNQAQGEAIEIVGDKEGVEEAKRLVLEAVKRGGGSGGRK